MFRNVRYNDLVALVNFIYQGEVNVVQEQLSSFLATAELLAVKGLTDCNDNADKIKEEEWDFEVIFLFIIIYCIRYNYNLLSRTHF